MRGGWGLGGSGFWAVSERGFMGFGVGFLGFRVSCRGGALNVIESERLLGLGSRLGT